MRDIPPDTLKLFSEMLKKRSVHSSLHSYYLKWLRYYLDYCSKYRLPEKSSRSMTQFLRKLKDKKQTEAQQKQAGHAVSLYLDLEKTVKTIPSNIAPAIVQPPTLNPYSTLPSEKQEGFRTRRNDSPASESAPKPSANNERRPLPAPAEKTRRPGVFKQHSDTGDAKARWQKAIAELTSVIKTKHYSPKTLRSYRHWACKLQTFRKTVDPAALGPEDVKAFLSWLAVSCKVSASSQNQAFGETHQTSIIPYIPSQFRNSSFTGKL